MFSKATLAETLTIIKDWRHADLDNFFIRYNIPNEVYNNKDFNKLQKLNSVINYLNDNAGLEGIYSKSLSQDVISEIIDFLLENEAFIPEENKFSVSKNLYNLIKRDGFEISNNKLVKIVPSPLEIKKEENLVYTLLEKHNFNIPKRHLEMALDAYGRGDWAASNGQLRNYVEGLLSEMAEKITGTTFISSHQARQSLANNGTNIFFHHLNEWDSRGKGYFNVFWSRLHPHGSHPGLSDEQDCIFRINIILINTAEILRRYDKSY